MRGSVLALAKATRRYVALDENALRDLAKRDWTLVNGHLQKISVQPSHTAAAEVALLVAQTADTMNHHAEIRIRYKTLTFLLRSNDSGSVSNYDAKLANAIDNIAKE